MIGANYWKVFHNWCLLIGAGASVVAGARQRFTLVHLSFAVSPGFPFDLEVEYLNGLKFSTWAALNHLLLPDGLVVRVQQALLRLDQGLFFTYLLVLSGGRGL